MLLDQKLTLNDLPIVEPVDAGRLRDYLVDSAPPTPEREQVESMIGRLAIAMPSARISDDEARERLRLYWSALRDHALPDLQAAFGVLLKRCQFFPTIAEIEDVITPIRAKRERRRRAASMLVLKHDREWRPADEDFVAVQDVAALLASMRVGGNIAGGLNG